MKRKLIPIVALLAAINLMALPAQAKSSENETTPNNARLMGYEKEYKVEESNATLIYLYWTLFLALGIGVLFIKSKRTHLD